MSGEKPFEQWSIEDLEGLSDEEYSFLLEEASLCHADIITKQIEGINAIVAIGALTGTLFSALAQAAEEFPADAFDELREKMSRWYEGVMAL